MEAYKLGKIKFTNYQYQYYVDIYYIYLYNINNIQNVTVQRDCITQV